MQSECRILLRLLAEATRDILPIVALLALAQLALEGGPPPDLGALLVGLACLLVGLTLLLRGLAVCLLPLGEGLADAIARRGSTGVLLAFAFALGFGSTVAEPALTAVVAQVVDAAVAQGLVEDSPAALGSTALVLRYLVAAAVGVGVVLGVLRILLGWPVAWVVLAAHGLVLLLIGTGASPLAGAALDSGAAALSAINIPLITALGVGLATVLVGRNPLVDGFGMVALASVMPMLAILAAGPFLLGLS